MGASAAIKSEIETGSMASASGAGIDTNKNAINMIIAICGYTRICFLGLIYIFLLNTLNSKIIETGKKSTGFIKIVYSVWVD